LEFTTNRPDDLQCRSYKTLYADGVASFSYYNRKGQLTNQ